METLADRPRRRRTRPGTDGRDVLRGYYGLLRKLSMETVADRPQRRGTRPGTNGHLLLWGDSVGRGDGLPRKPSMEAVVDWP